MPKIRGVNHLENPAGGEDHVKNPVSKFLWGSCFLHYLLCYSFLVPIYLYFLFDQNHAAKCQIRNSPGFDPSILRPRRIKRAAEGAALNKGL